MNVGDHVRVKPDAFPGWYLRDWFIGQTGVIQHIRRLDRKDEFLVRVQRGGKPITAWAYENELTLLLEK